MAGWDTFFPASGAEAFANSVMQAALVYPHQLFSRHPAVEGADLCVLVEDPLFFRQYAFHAQKLVLHRASMAHWAQTQSKQGRRVETVASAELEHSADIVPWLKRQGVTRVRLVDPCDDWLHRRLTAALDREGLPYELLPDPHFLTPVDLYHQFGHR
jgi:deoxyribodipyrimidine photolyase-related protein